MRRRRTRSLEIIHFRLSAAFAVSAFLCLQPLHARGVVTHHGRLLGLGLSVRFGVDRRSDVRLRRVEFRLKLVSYL